MCDEEVVPVENAGIDPATSRMLSERSTIWANSPTTIGILPYLKGDSEQEC